MFDYKTFSMVILMHLLRIHETGMTLQRDSVASSMCFKVVPLHTSGVVVNSFTIAKTAHWPVSVLKMSRNISIVPKFLTTVLAV